MMGKTNSNVIFLEGCREDNLKKKKEKRFLPWKLNVFELEVSRNTEDLKYNIIFRVTPNQLLKQMFVSK